MSAAYVVSRKRSSAWKTQLQREAVADAVLRIVAARLMPTIGAEELAQVVGVSVEDLRDALERHRHAERAKRNSARGLGTKPNAKAPRGQLWCSGMPGARGHYVDVALMVRNATSRTGYHNMCREHHAAKAQARKARLRERRSQAAA